VKRCVRCLLILAGCCLGGLATHKADAQIASYGLMYDTLWFSGYALNSLNDGEPCYALISKELDKNKINKEPHITDYKKLDLTGEISYEFLYRSQIDTPFAQKDFRQHIVRGAFRTDILNKYPVKINMAYKVSNSPFMRNTIDVSLGFDPLVFRKRVEERLLMGMQERLEQRLGLAGLEQEYKSRMADVTHWGEVVSSPDFSMAQKRKAEGIIGDISNMILNGDSTADVDSVGKYVERYLKGGIDKKQASLFISGHSSLPREKATAILDSFDVSVDWWQEQNTMYANVVKQAAEASGRLQKSRQMLNDSLSAYRARLMSARDGRILRRLVNEAGLYKDSVSGLQRLMMSFQTLSVGRNMMDWTPLTVRNISVTGVSAAAAPSIYIALAAGYMDYSFRDFMPREQRSPQQRAVMIRAGLSGLADRGFFVTAYSARRAISAGTSGSRARYFNANGYSLQYIWEAKGFGTVSAELAKSNAPAYRPSPGGKNAPSLFSFGSRGNEAYSLALNGTVPVLRTKIKASYQKNGDQFQSLSMYTYNARQTAYMLTVDQPLLRDILTVRAGIRKNDFVYPYLTNLSSNSVFKTAQLTFRKRGLPTLVAGYYPATQLVMLPDSAAAEFAYHTLSASAMHLYKVGGLSNSSMLMYSKFYNKGNDTSFLYFNARYWSYQHFLWLPPFTLQAGYTRTSQQATSLGTLEASLSWMHSRGAALSGGFKWNHSGKQENLWGGSLRATVPLKRLGVILVSYERGAFPAWQQRKLVPVSTGRVVYSKTF
jgi:hypothetical protein